MTASQLAISNIFFNNCYQLIAIISVAKYLGPPINNKLSWTYHVV